MDSKVEEFHDQGFVCLEGAVDVSLIEKLRVQTMGNYEECMSIIKERELEFGIGIKHGFKEVVQRHTARFEMTHRMEELDCSFMDDEDSPIRQTVRGILGDDCIVANKSAVVSLAGASGQSWHSDGPHMSSTTHLPAHVLNVFIPLVPMTKALGATEFRPKVRTLFAATPPSFQP